MLRFGAVLQRKKFYLVCSGCPEGRIDSSRVLYYLEANGWDRTDVLEEADLVMYRGCGLTKENINEGLRLIKELKSNKKPDAQFIVWGCLSKIDPESLRTVYSGVTFGEENVDLLDQILDAKKPIDEVVANSVMPIYKFQWHGIVGLISRVRSYISDKLCIVRNPNIFQIKVSTGCLDNCSFCSVHKSRGLLHSKTIEQIVAEFREGLQRGYHYFGLLGTDVGAYGQDIGHNLPELLAELTKEKGNYKIGLRKHPSNHLINSMYDDLKPYFASGQIWFVSSSVESGSNRILKLMRRRYTIQEYVKYMRMLNKEFPKIFLRTQIMVGFPTETEEDFQLSIRLIYDVNFDWVEVYCFSPTPGIDASSMDGQISESIKEQRLNQLYMKPLFQRPCRKMKHLLTLYR